MWSFSPKVAAILRQMSRRIRAFHSLSAPGQVLPVEPLWEQFSRGPTPSRSRVRPIPIPPARTASHLSQRKPQATHSPQALARRLWLSDKRANSALALHRATRLRAPASAPELQSRTPLVTRLRVTPVLSHCRSRPARQLRVAPAHCLEQRRSTPLQVPQPLADYPLLRPEPATSCMPLMAG